MLDTDDPSVLGGVRQGLVSKNKLDQEEASDALRDRMTLIARDKPAEEFKRECDTVCRIIGQLILHGDTNERFGGLLALGRLMDLIAGSAAQFVPRLVSYLNKALQSNDANTLICAADSLGHLVTRSEFLAKELVKSEVLSALECTQSEKPGSKRLLAAFLTIKSLAVNTPSLVLRYAVEIFESAWVGLRDSDPLVRATASEAIGESLRLTVLRNQCLGQQWCMRFRGDILLGLESNDVHWILGSLLLWKELSVHYGILTFDQYKATCELVLRLTNHGNARIPAQIITTLPIFAKQFPAVFTQAYLPQTMSFLKAQLKKGKERDAVFHTVGEIAIGVGDRMAPYMDDIMSLLQDGLARGKGQLCRNEASILNCIRMLSIALGPAFATYAEKLLEPMLGCGLCQELRDAVQTIADQNPPLKPVIQKRLLSLLEKTLISSNQEMISGSKTQLPAKAATKDDGCPALSHTTVVFALNALGEFDFGSLAITDIVQNAVVIYVEHGNAEVRKTAALTCFRYFLRDLKLNQPNCKHPRIPRTVFKQLLSLSVADSDPSIREAVLLAFSREFDSFLAEPDHIRCLSLSVNDEVLRVRVAAVCIIGRLSSSNPAYVLPSLRKLILNLLVGLNLAQTIPQKLEALQMINSFALNSTSLLEPFVGPILDVLLPKGTDDSQAVATATLVAIGSLFRLTGRAVHRCGTKLMPSLLRSLDSLTSNDRREAALEAISQLAQNSGSTTLPYLEYPELLPALIKMVKVEDVETIRKSAIRLFGTVGALDPVKCLGPNESTLEVHQLNQVPTESRMEAHMRRLDVTDAEIYRSDVFNALVDNILREPSLKAYHQPAIDAVVMVCKVTGIESAPFLDKIVPAFLSVIQTSSPATFAYYFGQLSALVDAVGYYVRPYATDLIDLVRQYWPIMDEAPLVSLIKTMAMHMGDDMSRHISGLLRLMLTTLEHGASSAAGSILHLLAMFGNSVEQYMHSIVPALLRVISSSHYPKELRRSAINCIANLSDEIDLSDFASPLVQCLAKVLSGGDDVLMKTSLDYLCVLIHQLGPDYMRYAHTVNSALVRSNITHDGYSVLVSKLRKGEDLPPHLGWKDQNKLNQILRPQAEILQRPLNLNLERLRNAWDTSRIFTTREWQQWLQELTLQLLEENPCPTVRACANLAELYYPFAKTLFITAFSSCWTGLPEEYQVNLGEAVLNALSSPNIPYEIVSTLLNLAEFMQRTRKPFPIDTRLLSYHAIKSHTYAKALHYEELHFDKDRSLSSLETIMAINNNLQQHDSAHGIVRTSHALGNKGVQEYWLENLHYWKAALTSYEKRERDHGYAEHCEDWSITLGKIRCLHALEDWHALSEMAEEKWTRASPEHQRVIAPLAATAAWRLSNWSLMQTLHDGMTQGTADRSFFGAVLAVHKNQFDVAAAHIQEAQKRLDPELTVLLNESYGRSYEVIVRLHMLAELEEIIIYKTSTDDKRTKLRLMWNQRLLGCQRSVEVWQRILNLRALSGCSVLEDVRIWIKFANMCRNENRLQLAEKTIGFIEEATSNVQPSLLSEIRLSRLRINWKMGRRREAFNELKDLTRELEQQIAMNLSYPLSDGSYGVNSLANPRKVISKCYRSLAEWQTTLHEGHWTLKQIQAILNAYKESVHHNRQSYKACHAWALAAYRAARLTPRDICPMLELPKETLRNYVISAVQALYQSISLSSTSCLQDILRVLTLWFTHGNEKEVNAAVTGGFSLITIDAWLSVIPQLVARITSPNELVRGSVQLLLLEVAQSHPQALVYPVAVAMESKVAKRSQSACDIIEEMRRYSPTLVRQADTVSHELIRVAALWHELWYETIQEAAKYCDRGDFQGVIDLLRPLHIKMDAGPETLSEASFVQTFGTRLKEAKNHAIVYMATREVADFQHAWAMYISVYRRLENQFKNFKHLNLATISPKLKSCVNLDIAVPGTYRNGAPVVKVAHFDPYLLVLDSKKRPRRLKIFGDDGHAYMYLLKGQEDIRQDERVMQLFGLLNTLFAGDSESVQRHLAVQPYQAIPLSQNSGILGWVSNSDTFNTLVKDYRKTHQVPADLEMKLILRLVPNYDTQPLLRKIETFRDIMSNTSGKELYHVLWLQSASSEVWLGRRTHYTRSLAVMSMVGYILGLGDRHPANLLLHRDTGNIVHVDYGDCFEATRQRERFSEQVPFRLTRMLVIAMGIGNVEGNFRVACEIVMRVLRTHKDSIMTILEAFLHDPLLDWQGKPCPNPQPRAGEIIVPDVAQSPESFSRRFSALGAGVLDPLQGAGSAGGEDLNTRAIEVLARVRQKLTGRDFKGRLSIEEQVRKLIEEATNVENLCQHYAGWCAFW